MYSIVFKKLNSFRRAMLVQYSRSENHPEILFLTDTKRMSDCMP